MKIKTELELPIKTDTKTLRRLNVSYHLFARNTKLGTRFFISVRTQDDFSQAEIGSDLFVSLDFYNRIVKGGVTPCTLSDVMESLLHPSLPRL